MGAGPPAFADMARLRVARDVVRETLRLYPPVPMMVREASRPERFRGRDVARGAQIVLSPWHLHRHARCGSGPTRSTRAALRARPGARACAAPISRSPSGSGPARARGSR